MTVCAFFLQLWVTNLENIVLISEYGSYSNFFFLKKKYRSYFYLENYPEQAQEIE